MTPDMLHEITLSLMHYYRTQPDVDVPARNIATLQALKRVLEPVDLDDIRVIIDELPDMPRIIAQAISYELHDRLTAAIDQAEQHRE